MAVDIPVSWGEVFDKITILEIKSTRIEDPAKLINIRKELDILNHIASEHGNNNSEQLDKFLDQLRQINTSLWEIEDDIRECERKGAFGPEFIKLARSVYQTNDQRSIVKRHINLLLGSALVEEKSYQAY